jgi:hypothetical protein
VSRVRSFNWITYTLLPCSLQERQATRETALHTNRPNTTLQRIQTTNFSARETTRFNKRIASSGMLRCVALVRTDVLEELSASIIRVTRIDELEMLAVTSNLRRLLVMANVVPSSQILVALMMEALSSSETSVLTRTTRRNIPEDAILHSHRRENLKSYIPKEAYPCSWLTFNKP